jgi:tetrapyrrole methylase family protein/MazG family protein
VDTPGQALAQWEAIKHREAESEGRRRSVIEGVPRALPSLLRAQRIQSKAARVNFDWPDAGAAWAKVEEEVREASAALARGDREQIQEELGDVLFSLVNVARLSAVDAEEALHGAIEKFRRRFTTMEDDLIARGKSVASVSSEELERSWEAVKAQERSR